MIIYTIGFTKKSAEDFFEKIINFMFYELNCPFLSFKSSCFMEVLTDDLNNGFI